MANINAPFGLRPVKHLDGASWNQQVTMYYIPSTDTNAYYIGDVVQAAANGDPIYGASAVTLAGTRGTPFTSGNVRGVVVGIGTQVQTPAGSLPGMFDPNNLNVVYIPATKTQNYYVWVCDDPSVIYEIQADSGVLSTTSFNKNAAFTPTANTSTLTTSGGVLQSATVLQTSSAAVTSTLPLRLMGGKFQPDVDLTSGYAVYYVKLNTPDLAAGTAGV
jgi:hypothetical protein